MRSFRASVFGCPSGKPQVGNAAGIVETCHSDRSGAVVILSLGTKIGCADIYSGLENDAEQE